MSVTRLSRLSDRAALEYAEMWTDDVRQGTPTYASVDPLTDTERQSYFETVCRQAYGKDDDLLEICASN